MPPIRTPLIILALAMLAPGATSATPPKEDGIIHACVRYRGGFVRIVAGPESCRRFERPISWAATGPVGPAGPAGPPGPSGLGNAVYLTSTGSVAVLEGDPTREIPGLGAAVAVAVGARLLVQGDLREHTACPDFVDRSFIAPPWTIELKVDGVVVARREAPGDQGNVWNPVSHPLVWLSAPLPEGSHSLRFLLSAPPAPGGTRPSQARVCLGDANDASGRQARVAILELRP